MAQLEQDLRNHIDNKLNRWLKDASALYEMADIKAEAGPAIAEVLLRCLCAGMVANGLTDEDIHHCIRLSVARARRARARIVGREHG